MSLFRAKMAQQRPLLLREVKTWLLDCGVAVTLADINTVTTRSVLYAKLHYPAFLQCPLISTHSSMGFTSHTLDISIFNSVCDAVHPSVCPSVTCQYAVEMAKHILKLFSPSGGHTILEILSILLSMYAMSLTYIFYTVFRKKNIYSCFLA